MSLTSATHAGMLSVFTEGCEQEGRNPLGGAKGCQVQKLAPSPSPVLPAAPGSATARGNHHRSHWGRNSIYIEIQMLVGAQDHTGGGTAFILK